MRTEYGYVVNGARTALTSALALALAFGSAAPAWAAITNIGSVSASTPDGGTVGDTSAESVTVAAPIRNYAIVKSVSSITVASGDDVAFPDGGDTITYQYSFDNTGNVSLDGTSVVITDPGPTFDGSAATNFLSAVAYVSGDTDSDTQIDPSETWIYQATYLLAQADVDNAAGVAAGVSNTITSVVVNAVGGTPATDSGSTLTATDTIPENAVVNLTKQATRDGTIPDNGSVTAYTEGETIQYLFTVTNQGNVTLTSLTVTETNFVAPSGSSAPTITCTISTDATIASLAPGASETCSASYTILPTDL